MRVTWQTSLYPFNHKPLVRLIGRWRGIWWIDRRVHTGIHTKDSRKKSSKTVRGLCKKVGKFEIVRSKRLISTKEAMARHVSFCRIYISSIPPPDPTLYLIATIRQILRPWSSTTKSSDDAWTFWIGEFNSQPYTCGGMKIMNKQRKYIQKNGEWKYISWVLIRIQKSCIIKAKCVFIVIYYNFQINHWQKLSKFTQIKMETWKMLVFVDGYKFVCWIDWSSVLHINLVIKCINDREEVHFSLKLLIPFLIHAPVHVTS